VKGGMAMNFLLSLQSITSEVQEKMKKFLFLLSFICLALSCEKEYHTTIPYAPVNLELKLETLDYELKTNLAYKTITQPRTALERLGFGGILVVNGMGENLINLYAYDLACPVEAQHNVRVVPDNLGSPTSTVKTAITATCPDCGSVFFIATGTGAPQSGTKYHLRSYKVSGNGSQFTVHN